MGLAIVICNGCGKKNTITVQETEIAETYIVETNVLEEMDLEQEVNIKETGSVVSEVLGTKEEVDNTLEITKEHLVEALDAVYQYTYGDAVLNEYSQYFDSLAEGEYYYGALPDLNGHPGYGVFQYYMREDGSISEKEKYGNPYNEEANQYFIYELVVDRVSDNGKYILVDLAQVIVDDVGSDEVRRIYCNYFGYSLEDGSIIDYEKLGEDKYYELTDY